MHQTQKNVNICFMNDMTYSSSWQYQDVGLIRIYHMNQLPLMSIPGTTKTKQADTQYHISVIWVGGICVNLHHLEAKTQEQVVPEWLMPWQKDEECTLHMLPTFTSTPPIHNCHVVLRKYSQSLSFFVWVFISFSLSHVVLLFVFAIKWPLLSCHELF